MAVDKSMMTRLTHAGGSDFVKKVQRGVSVPQVAPIYMSSVFAFDDVASLDAVYEQEADGYFQILTNNNLIYAGRIPFPDNSLAMSENDVRNSFKLITQE